MLTTSLASPFVPAARAVSPALEWSFAPVVGTLTSPFGWRIDPFNGNRHFHYGIDLAAPYGTPIYAAQAGIVTYSGPFAGYGNVVAIYHGGTLFTLYGHTSHYFVQRGDRVRRGQLIAAIGSTGRSTGPHLHFEVHDNHTYVNPIQYLSALMHAGYSPLAHQAGTLYTDPGTYDGGTIVARLGKQHAASTRIASDDDDQGVTPALPAIINISRNVWHPRPVAGKTMEVVSGTQLKTIRF